MPSYIGQCKKKTSHFTQCIKSTQSVHDDYVAQLIEFCKIYRYNISWYCKLRYYWDFLRMNKNESF